jgi:hypothetical protein
MPRPRDPGRDPSKQRWTGCDAHQGLARVYGEAGSKAGPWRGDVGRQVRFTTTALIPCSVPSGSRRRGTPGARLLVFETVVVLDGSSAVSCSVSSSVSVLGAAFIISGDGTLGMTRLTVRWIGVGVRAELWKDAAGCGAPEHAAAERSGAARCDGPGRSREVEQEVGKAQSVAVNRKARRKGKIPIGLGTRSGWGFGPRLGAQSMVGEGKSRPGLRLGARVMMATWPCTNGEQRPMGVTVQG